MSTPGRCFAPGFNGKVNIKPAKKAVKGLLAKVRNILKRNVSTKPGEVIRQTQSRHPRLGELSPLNPGALSLIACSTDLVLCLLAGQIVDGHRADGCLSARPVSSPGAVLPDHPPCDPAQAKAPPILPPRPDQPSERVVGQLIETTAEELAELAQVGRSDVIPLPVRDLGERRSVVPGGARDFIKRDASTFAKLPARDHLLQPKPAHICTNRPVLFGGRHGTVGDGWDGGGMFSRAQRSGEGTGPAPHRPPGRCVSKLTATMMLNDKKKAGTSS
jgi:hypothetical protein